MRFNKIRTVNEWDGGTMGYDCYVKISDENLSKMVRAILELEGIRTAAGEGDDYRILICDDTTLPDDLHPFGGVIVIGEEHNIHSAEHVTFLERPFDIRELIEKIRESQLPVGVTEKRVSSASRVVIHSDGTVSFGEAKVTLTEREGMLFSYLYKNRHRPVPREELMRRVWGETTSTNITEVYVSYLRKKLEPLFGDGVIVSLRGRGYLMKLPHETGEKSE